MQTTNNSSRATFAVTPYNTDPPNSVDRNVISPEEMPVKSARIAGKNHDPVWRNPDRRNNVRFEFTTPEGGTFEVRCEDASIRSARFSLTDKQRILASHSSAKIFLSDQPMVAKQIRLRELPYQAKPGYFVVDYKTCQFAAGQIIEAKAHYEILESIGAGQSAETYKAKVVRTCPQLEGLKLGDEVVVKVPLFDPCRWPQELIEFSLKLVTLFFREEASLLRLASLDCVAGFVETGDHKFPIPDVPKTRLLIQKYVKGKPLDEHLQCAYADPDSKQFKGLRARDFYRLGRELAEAVRKAHSKLVIHGDIWPENILVSTNGRPILIDFGQAAFREAIGPAIEIEGRNARYIAPEKGKSVGGDIYSLGGVLYYLATGEDPPERLASDIDELKIQIAEAVRTANPQLYEENRGAVDIIAHCLRTSDQRTAHVHLIIQDLDTFFGERAQTTVVKAIRSVISEGERLDQSGHELFRSMAVGTLNALVATLSEMNSGIYDLVGDHNVIVSGFTEYLRLLGNDDQYLTVSVPKFWYPRNLGINGYYLTSNILAAQRGAVVKRLFITTDADRQTAEFQSLLQAQRQVWQELAASPPIGCYEVKTYNVSEDEAADIMKKGHHFGLLVRRQDEIAVFPEYRNDGSLAAVRFRSNLVGGLRPIFEKYWCKAKSLF